eukprot:TRINITY_DN25871_c0_g1_i2.p1 TRINITY_DN25871_c0_g1~~TRINITY_DN25871_c0_g1_i2.p1  ORF type:complete len:220 (-),score=42.01 TRINITY_DN25871_c0_g1_i2:49-651(-)
MMQLPSGWQGILTCDTQKTRAAAYDVCGIQRFRPATATAQQAVVIGSPTTSSIAGVQSGSPVVITSPPASLPAGSLPAPPWMQSLGSAAPLHPSAAGSGAYAVSVAPAVAAPTSGQFAPVPASMLQTSPVTSPVASLQQVQPCGGQLVVEPKLETASPLNHTPGNTDPALGQTIKAKDAKGKNKKDSKKRKDKSACCFCF